jgi:hypothetical protein
MTSPLHFRVLAPVIAAAFLLSATAALTGQSSSSTTPSSSGTTPMSQSHTDRGQTSPSAVPQTFSALAIDMNAGGSSAAAVTVQIGIDRWSTDAERDALYNTLIEQGPEKLLDKLQSMPKVGYIRTPASIGYDLRFARDGRMGEDERIILATDRPIGFWEASTKPQLSDYPFTVIEMRIKPNGEGEGKLSVATKITADPDEHTLMLENYTISPITLSSVKRDKK